MSNSDQLTDFLKKNSEPLNIFLLLGFISLTVYILLNYVDPAESAAARQKEIEFAKTCQKSLDRENRERSRYTKLLQKIDKITNQPKHIL